MYKKIHLSLLFTLIMLTYIFSNSVETTIPITLNVTSVVDVNIENFTISSSEITEGDSVGFTVVMTNVGNVITEVATSIYIYDSNNNSIDQINYVNITLAAGETQTLTTSWSSSGLSAGEYSAFVNSTYNGTITNNMNLTFTVSEFIPIYHPSSDSNDYDTQVEEEEIVEELPPEEILEETSFEVLRSPVLKELSQGENTVVFLLVENPSEEEISIDAVLDTSNSPFISESSVVRIPSKQEKSVMFSIQVPEDAPLGYYLLNLDLSMGETETSYPIVLRVLSSKTDVQAPRLFREFSIDLEKNSSIVSLTLDNEGKESIEHIQVYEEIPKSVSSDFENIEFTDEPTKIMKESSLVRWDFENMLADETRTLSYEVSSIPDDYSKIIMWPSVQIITIQPKYDEAILVGDLIIPSILSGEKGKIDLELFNAGALDQVVDITILHPEGWNVRPNTFSLHVASRESAGTSFYVDAPVSAEPTSYGFTLQLSYEGEVDEKYFSLSVIEPMIEQISTPIPALRYQLWEWILRNQYNLLTWLVVGLVLLVVGSTAYRRLKSKEQRKGL